MLEEQRFLLIDYHRAVPKAYETVDANFQPFRFGVVHRSIPEESVRTNLSLFGFPRHTTICIQSRSLLQVKIFAALTAARAVCAITWHNLSVTADDVILNCVRCFSAAPPRLTRHAARQRSTDLGVFPVSGLGRLCRLLQCAPQVSEFRPFPPCFALAMQANRFGQANHSNSDS